MNYFSLTNTESIQTHAQNKVIPADDFSMLISAKEALEKTEKEVEKKLETTKKQCQNLRKKAKEEGKDVQDFVNENVEKFYESVKLFGVSDDINFIRTSDPHHTKAAQEFWKRVNSNGFIYKKNYQTNFF